MVGAPVQAHSVLRCDRLVIERRGSLMSVAYVARYQRLGPILMIVGGVAIPVGSLWVMAGRPLAASGFVYAAFNPLIFVALIGLGGAQLGRGWKNGWVALSIDRDGISFGAQGHVRISWDDISALVLFARRTDFVRGTVKCVGVRLHPCATKSPEAYAADLKQVRSRPDLTFAERARLDKMALSLEMAVSVHAEARGWGFTRSRIKDAIHTYAPGVPVVECDSSEYYQLVGWRADQEELRQIVENAELRHWR